MPRSPQWINLYQIWFRGSPRGRNQMCGILLQSAHGFRFCEGSKFAISHWLCRSPLTQCWRYCAACDLSVQRESWSKAIRVDLRRWYWVEVELKLSWLRYVLNERFVRELVAEERSSWWDICSLVDGDVFECLREVVRAVQRYCGHSAWVLCSSGEVSVDLGPDV